MKKNYLLAILLINTLGISQGIETFETQSVLTASYADGSFAGETPGVTINYIHSKNEGSGTSGDYSISGKGIILRRSNEPSSVEFLIPNGVGTFSFEYRKAFKGASVRKLAVMVDGVEVNTTPGFGANPGTIESAVYTLNTPINKTGDVAIKITYPERTPIGNKQITIDNVSWTVPNLSIEDMNDEKNKLVLSHTLLSDQVSVLWKGTSKVEFYSINSNLVKSVTVTENQPINTQDLMKGVYFIRVTNRGKTETVKVIKK